MLGRAVVTCVGLLSAVGFGSVAEADFAPLADYRVVDPAGDYYVVWRRTDGPELYGEWGPTEFTIARRAPGTPKVTPAQAQVANLAGQGGRFYRMLENPNVAVRPGDVRHGSGLFPRPPRVVLVSSSGLGFVALDAYGPNVPEVAETRGEHAVVVVSLEGRVRHAKALGQLFTDDEIDAFASTGTVISWLRGGWIDQQHRGLVIVGGNDEIRVLDLVSGQVRVGGESDVVGGITSRDPQAVSQALTIAAQNRLPAALAPARLVFADRLAGADVRLRAAVAMAVLGDLSGAALIERIARGEGAEGVADGDGQTAPERSVAIEYLPEAIGDSALPLLSEALGRGRLDGAAAFRALTKLDEKAVPVLVPLVEPGVDQRLRLAAIGVLGIIGPDARRAVDPLSTALEDDSPLVRVKAALSLAKIAPGTPGILAQLQAGLSFDPVEPLSLPIRHASAESLVGLGPEGCEVLAQVLGGDSSASRRTTAAALSRLGRRAAPAADALVAALNDRDRPVRNLALAALESIGVEALPALSGGLTNPDASIRGGSAFVLGRLGPPVRPAAELLATLLDDDSPLVRTAAAGALVSIEPGGVRGVGTLVELLKHRDELVQAKAAFRLGQFGPAAGAAVGPLVELLDDCDTVAAAAAGALGKIGPRALVSVEPLVAASVDGGRLLRRGAVESLGRFGPAAGAAVPVLIEALEDEDWQVPHLAATALGRIDTASAEVVRALVSAVDQGQGDAELRIAALESLASLDPGTTDVVPVLIRALSDPCLPVARQAVRSLGAVGPEAVDRLAEALRHPSRDVRLSAAEALGLIGPPASGAADRLIEALADADVSTGFYAEEPLVKIGPAATDRLIEALDDERPEVRACVARILGQLGPSAAEAVEALRGTLEDPDEYTRSVAAWALEEIERE